jgi:hypothetical protein
MDILHGEGRSGVGHVLNHWQLKGVTKSVGSRSPIDNLSWVFGPEN